MRNVGTRSKSVCGERLGHVAPFLFLFSFLRLCSGMTQLNSACASASASVSTISRNDDILLWISVRRRHLRAPFVFLLPSNGSRQWQWLSQHFTRNGRVGPVLAAINSFLCSFYCVFSSLPVFVRERESESLIEQQDTGCLHN